MRWRRLLVLFAAIAIVVIANIAVRPRTPPKSHICVANHWRIQHGMTRAQVKALLGGPAGDYTTGPIKRVFDYRSYVHKTHYSHTEEWITDDGIVDVRFSTIEENTVVAVRQINVESTPQTRWENVLWRLQRRLRRYFS